MNLDAVPGPVVELGQRRGPSETADAALEASPKSWVQIPPGPPGHVISAMSLHEAKKYNSGLRNRSSKKKLLAFYRKPHASSEF